MLDNHGIDEISLTISQNAELRNWIHDIFSLLLLHVACFFLLLDTDRCAWLDRHGVGTHRYLGGIPKVVEERLVTIRSHRCGGAAAPEHGVGRQGVKFHCIHRSGAIRMPK
jgi:hypothetical protein